MDLGELTLGLVSGPGLRNFFDLDSSGDKVGVVIFPGNKNETIEFFLDPGFSLLYEVGVSSSCFPIHSLLLAGVILSLKYYLILLNAGKNLTSVTLHQKHPFSIIHSCLVVCQHNVSQ